MIPFSLIERSLFSAVSMLSSPSVLILFLWKFDSQLI